MLDTSRTVETPEGVELQLQLAGPVVRGCAYCIDVLIRMGIYIALSIIFSVLGTLGAALILISFFLIEWFYPVVFEVTSGSTPGKKTFGLQVCRDDGTPIDAQSSMLRNFLLVADFLPLFYCFGIFSMLANRDFKRLGDIAAGTVVIYSNEDAKEYALPKAQKRTLPVSLNLSEQQAILMFSERENDLSKARAEELANVLEPLTECRDQQATDTIHGYAQWIQKGNDQ